MLDDLSSKFDAEMIKWKSDLRGKDAEILEVKQSLQTAQQQLSHTHEVTQVTVTCSHNSHCISSVFTAMLYLWLQRLAQSEESVKSQLSQISHLTSLLEEANHVSIDCCAMAETVTD